MKLTIRMLALAAAAALTLCGCGGLSSGASGESAAQSAAQTPETFGAAEIADSPTLMAETTQAPEPTPSPTPTPAPEETPQPTPTPAPAPADMTELLLKSALCADYIDDLWYAPEEPQYFWRAVGYLMMLAGPQIPDATQGQDEQGATLRLPASALDELAGALFAGAFAESEYPSLSEENPLVSWESTEEGEFYLVQVQDLADYTVTYQETDWAEHYTATLQRGGEAVASYEVTMEPSEGDLFPLHITELAYAGSPE